MQFDIPDTSAATVARAFYDSLADGFPVQAAVTEGRKAILAETGPDCKDWATPALFMRSPTGVLFMQSGGTDERISTDTLPKWKRLQRSSVAGSLCRGQATTLPLHTREGIGDILYGAHPPVSG